MNRLLAWLCLGLLPFLLLLGCATRPPTVDVPLAVGCIMEIPRAPLYSDNAAAIRAARGIEERARLVIAGRVQRDGYIDKLTSVLEACKLPVF